MSKPDRAPWGNILGQNLVLGAVFAACYVFAAFQFLTVGCALCGEPFYLNFDLAPRPMLYSLLILALVLTFVSQLALVDCIQDVTRAWDLWQTDHQDRQDFHDMYFAEDEL